MALLSALAGFVSVKQNHAFQQEDISWMKNCFALDSQALKIDLFRAARKDVTHLFDGHIEQLDGRIFLNGLLLTFILGILQTAGFYMPLSDVCTKNPDDCIILRHIWLKTIWVYIVGITLFVPFWAILILLACKSKLGGWLQDSLEDLQNLRKLVISDDVDELRTSTPEEELSEDVLLQEQSHVVSRISNFIIDHQDVFMELWYSDCSPRVSCATYMLWTSTAGSLTLTAFMFWTFVQNQDHKKGNFLNDASFASIASLGLLLPVAYFFLDRFTCKRRVPAQAHHETLLSPLYSQREAFVSLQPVHESSKEALLPEGASFGLTRPTSARALG